MVQHSNRYTTLASILSTSLAPVGQDKPFEVCGKPDTVHDEKTRQKEARSRRQPNSLVATPFSKCVGTMEVLPSKGSKRSNPIQSTAACIKPHSMSFAAILTKEAAKYMQGFLAQFSKSMNSWKPLLARDGQPIPSHPIPSLLIRRVGNAVGEREDGVEVGAVSGRKLEESRAGMSVEPRFKP